MLAATLHTNNLSGNILKQYVYGFNKAGNRTSASLLTSASTPSSLTTGTFNSLNQLTTLTAGGALRFKGHLSETGSVTVAGSPAIMTTATNFLGFATASVGTNVAAISATDLSTNSCTNRYQVVVTNSGPDQAFTYDLNGNLTTVVTASSTNTYDWDGANRLTKITQTSTNSPQLTSEFTYDGLGRRTRIIEKTNGVLQSDHRFLWCGSDLSEERDSTGASVVRRFLGVGEQISSTNLFFTIDHLGSIREMTDTSGTIRARNDYDPFGRRVKLTGDLDSDFGFAGTFVHGSSALALTVFRAYSSDTSRWISRDPMAEAGGQNLYAYCQNDPIGRRDKSGLWPWSPRVHHDYPQEFWAEFANIGVNVHAQENLTVLPQWAHTDLHSLGYNEKWEQFFYEDGKLIERTRAEAEAFLQQLKSEAGLKEIFDIGRPAVANYQGFEAIAPFVKNIGKAIVVLTVLDLFLHSDAYAQGIANNLKMFAQDCREGKDDWAYVDLLMMRHDMNQLALFSGDVAMRGMLKQMDRRCK